MDNKRNRKRTTYFASFESSQLNEESKLTSFAIRHIDESTYIKGNGVDSFMSALTSLPKQSKVYINNLGFRGRFISEYMIDNGYSYSKENINKLNGKYFSCLIDNSGSWFNINIKTDDVLVKIYDSSKKIPLKTDEVADAYSIERLNDLNEDKVNVWLSAISQHIDMGLKSNTISSDAMGKYKEIITRKEFDINFPKLDRDIDRSIRSSYSGAFNYMGKRSEIKEGYVIDIKSMYSYIMRNFSLPCGTPRILEGDRVRELDPDKYAQFFSIRAHAKVKKDHIPTVLHTISVQGDDNYMSEINGEAMTITYYDLQLLKSHYDITSLIIDTQYVFRSKKGLFTDYIDYYYELKEKSELEGNSSLRQISKLMLNSLYGKFGQLLYGISKYPTSEGYSRARISEESTVYVPMASYITSIGRWLIINAGQLNYKNLAYSDTDSLHIEGDIKDLVKGDFIRLGKELGDFDIEYKFQKAKYLKIKVYYLEGYEGNKVTVAGLSKKARSDISYRSFKLGMKIKNGAYRSMPTKGGSQMKFYDFTIE